MADNEEFTGQSIINRDFVTSRPSSMPIEYFVEEYGTPVVEKYQCLSFGTRCTLSSKVFCNAFLKKVCTIIVIMGNSFSLLWNGMNFDFCGSFVAVFVG